MPEEFNEGLEVCSQLNSITIKEANELRFYRKKEVKAKMEKK